MKTINWPKIAGVFLIVSALYQPTSSFAQLPLPPDPFYELDSFSFEDTNFLSDMGDVPISMQNLGCVPSFDGNAVQVDSTNAAWLQYSITNSTITNLTFLQGSIELWISPDWNSGSGPGSFGRLIDVGAYGTNTPSSWWSLYFTPDGSSINFSSETNGVFTNHLSVPIAWSSNEWHFLALTYNHFRSQLYVDGQLATNGGGVFYVPSSAVISNGFFVGSDSTGAAQCRACIDDMATYSYAIDAYDVTNDYLAGLELMDSGGFHPDDGGGGFMPPVDGGGGTNYDGGSSYITPDYGTNLWIADVNISSNLLEGIASNTIADVPYEIQSWTDLTQPTNWVSQGFFLGSETTNWTPLNGLAVSKTNNFFVRLRSWEDSDGTGIPDWWQLQYFGYVGVDPYGDPAGDGWNNLQKYLNGLNPTNFCTPAAPQGVAVTFTTNSIVTFSWLPSPGLVTGYSVTVHDWDTGETTNFNVSASITSISADLSAESTEGIADGYPQLYVDYSVAAVYGANGSSALGSASLEGTSPPAPTVFTGANGNITMALDGLPTDLGSINVFRQSLFGEINGISDLDDGVFVISAKSLTNGILEIPSSQAFPYSYYNFSMQIVRSNGFASDWSEFSSTCQHVPFIDGRPQLKDNLRFLLRAASSAGPFRFNYYPSVSEDIYSSPTNYVHSDYYFYVYTAAAGVPTFDVLSPIFNNYFFDNFVLVQTNLNTDGSLDTGVFYDFSIDSENNSSLYLPLDPLYAYNADDYITSTNPLAPASLLTTNLTTWILPTVLSPYISAGDKNYYGLPYTSVAQVQYEDGDFDLTAINPGATNAYAQYVDVAEPIFATNGYYFANIQTDAMPGQGGFAPTNTTRLMVEGFENPITIAGYSKLSMENSSVDVPCYLGQYFNQAYQIDKNGITTSNTTGILSPYGTFFATQPGAAALVTMPDIDTGEQGTCMVYAVSLQLDANHDGNMDLSYSGTDATSPSNPMRFWVNNGLDIPNSDLTLEGGLPPNYASQDILDTRDLENFARLWICGMPILTNGYQVALSWNATSGSPAINLYNSVETNGGIGYLTNTAVASEQGNLTVSDESPHGVAAGEAIAQIQDGASFTFPTGYFTNAGNKCFLFEGAGIGAGELVLTVTDINGNPVTQTGVWLDLHDVKDFYEQACATNVTSGNPPSSLVSNFKEIKRASPPPQNESKQIIVFIHGINNTDSDFENTSKTIYKRLYWSGYHGRFAGFHWPCAYLPYNTYNPFQFNKGEFYAWKSATALKDYLGFLRNRGDLAGFDIDLLAHSQGNIVASEALEQGATFDNYILSQAAVPAHAYDVNAPFLSSLTAADAAKPTPFYATNGGYHAYFTNLQGNLINFYNTNDFALASGITYVLGIPITSNWVENERTQKPESFLGGPSYSFSPSTLQSFAEYPDGIGNYFVTDLQECKALVARSHSSAIGAQGPVGGSTTQGPIGSSVDLINLMQIGSTRDEHSAQFSRPIQTAWGYYDQVLRSYRIQPNTR